MAVVQGKTELEAMVKESNSKSYRSTPAPTPPQRKVTWADIGKEFPQPPSHQLIPRPVWSDAKPKPLAPDFAV